MNIECSSVVSRVVVHARGALVTREVLLPQDLPSGVVDVDVPGITLQAEAGSARASLHESERVVASVHSEVVIPKGDVKRGPTVLLVRELAAKIARINDELRVLNERRKRLVELSIDPVIRTHDRTKRERDPLDRRFADALEMSSLVNEKTSGIDERIVALEVEHRKLTRELEAARVEDLQTSSRERMGESHPRRTITTRLVGEGRPGKLLVTYAIGAARWWPTYTLRVEEKNGGLRANWTFEAIVAQKSGEDWSAVELALSSADLIFDARLPELHSLRFGRAQPPRRRPFRPAPQGIDEMFSAYLAFGGRAFGVPPPPLTHALPTSTTATRSMDGFVARSGEDEEEELDEDTMVNALGGFGQPMDDGGIAEKSKRDEPATIARRLGARANLPIPQGEATRAPGGAPPLPAAPPMSAMTLAAAPMIEQQALAKRGGGLLGAIGGAALGAGGRARATRMMADKASMFEGGMLSDQPYEADILESEPELAPSDVWTNYDMLVLANADHGSKRGRLIPNVSAAMHDGTAESARAMREINQAADARYRDPLESRGMFDHRYEAGGRADIPSDGRVHRMTVVESPCTVKLAWRTVPSETEEVFREAHVTNPFDTGLLGGPVDVYLDGSLLASTMIDRIDRGGTLFCGMGVDDRVKVARNVRASEESAGLLGGSIAVTHVVDIELTSTIRDPIKVSVLERVPVTDDKAIEVKIVRANPLPDVYDQADRGAPIRGGCRFDVSVSPGKKTQVEVVYRLVFAQKLDIVGGSRRG